MIKLYLKIFVRSFFLQSLWNYERMQNIGFIFILKPFFDTIYITEEEKKEALLRHVGYFNTQPYMVGIIVGAVADIEKKIANTDVDGREEIIHYMNRVKSNISGPIAAISEPFFYGELRPMLSLLSMFIMIIFVKMNPEYIISAPIIFITLYNFVHLWTRIYFLYEGFKYAGKSMKTLAQFKSISDNVRFGVFVMTISAFSLYLAVFSFSSDGRLFNSGYIELFLYLVVFMFSFFVASKFGALFSMFAVAAICIIMSILL